MDANALFKLSYGLFVLSAKDGEKDNGCIINTVMQVTDSPKQVCIAVNKQNFTCEMIQKTGKFNLSILSEKAQFDLFKQFGFQSGRNADKFDGIKCERSENGLLYLTEQSNAYLSCSVVSESDLGSHIMFVASVDDAAVLNDDPSVTYDYYHKNIKPAPQKTEKKK